MKPKIIIFINSLSSGGAERVVSHLLWNLRDAFEIHLAMYSRIIDFKIPAEIKIFDLGQSVRENDLSVFMKMPLMAYRLQRYCKAHDIGTSVAFLNRPCYVNGLMRSLFGFKGRIVMCERTYQSTLLNSRGPLFKAISARLVKFAYKRANLVLANSYAMKADLVENFNIKTPVRAIHNPINIGYIKEKANESVNVCFSDKTFYFITVGGFRKEKNYALLVDAFFKLKQLPVQLLFVGAGPQEEYIKQKVHSLGLEEKVRFCGFDSNPYKYVLRSDCFVLSSYVEGFPNVLLEALACGKPVIATDCKSGPREILAPGTDIHHEATTNYEIAAHGILTPTHDAVLLAAAMKKIYEDVALRQSMEASAEQRARFFDLDEIIESFHVAFSG